MASDGSHADKFVRYMDNLTSLLIPALEASLPHHMVPEVYVPLTQLPTLGSGKLDRKTLRSIAGPLAFSVPSSGAANESTGQQQDESWREKLMRNFWAEVLGLQDRASIGKGDNFLGLGGDSIAAIKLAALISQHGASLSITEIFTYPTLETMSGATGAPVFPTLSQPSFCSTMRPCRILYKTESLNAVSSFPGANEKI
ncbi:hypothetical protein ACHAPU_010124 [Fusarium lateritium]